MQLSVLGVGLDGASGVHITGGGVAARIVGPPTDRRVEIAVDIAADAAPGPRAVVVTVTRQGIRERVFADELFHVRAPGSHGGRSGIGSHLI